MPHIWFHQTGLSWGQRKERCSCLVIWRGSLNSTFPVNMITKSVLFYEYVWSEVVKFQATIKYKTQIPKQNYFSINIIIISDLYVENFLSSILLYYFTTFVNILMGKLILPELQNNYGAIVILLIFHLPIIVICVSMYVHLLMAFLFHI